MCGLVGIAGDVKSHTITSIFRDLLDVSQIRGRDSTGVIHVAPDGNSYDWIKQIGGPSNLYNDRLYEKRIEKDASVVIGHTRAKTVGEVSVKNAHPFDFKDEGICGVHNGTLKNHYQLTGYHHSKVDSEVLYNHLAVHGPEETFDKVEGAYACVWWDANTSRLNFIRNSERPLYFAWSDDNKMMFWASEPWMFNVVARRIKLFSDEDDKNYHALPINTLWTFKINVKALKDERVVTLCNPRVILPKVKPVQSTFWPQRSWEKQEDGTYVEKEKGGEVVNPFSRERNEQDHGLNDDIPEFLKAPLTPSKSSLSSPSELSSETYKTTMELLTGSKSSVPSKKNILSLPDKSSTISRFADNVVQLERLNTSRNKPSEDSLTYRPKTTFRNVAGLDYISCASSGNEWEAGYFLELTKGCCSFCKTKYTDITQVGQIFRETFKSNVSFVCRPCLVEPSLPIVQTA